MVSLTSLSHNVVSSTPRLNGIRIHNTCGDSTDYIGNYKSNYYTITTTMASTNFREVSSNKKKVFKLFKIQLPREGTVFYCQLNLNHFLLDRNIYEVCIYK
jgi:hypothetical protein